MIIIKIQRSNVCSKCGNIKPHNKKCTKCSDIKRIEPKKNNNKNKSDKRSSKRWQTLRKRILHRDNYICQRCFTLENKIVTDSLEVHHIKSYRDYEELCFEESNCITVCHQCNMILGNSNKLDFEFNPNEIKEYSLGYIEEPKKEEKKEFRLIFL